MLDNPHSLLPVAYRAARQIVRSPLLAEEASERAVHKLTLAMLEGTAPHSPKAWLRVVARRSACALLRSEWARTRAADLTEVAEPRVPYAAGDPTRSRDHWVREDLQMALTPRQQEALSAAIRCNTTRAAARSCGMEPRDFRRSLGSISRRARRLLDDADGGDRLSPGAEPGLPA